MSARRINMQPSLAASLYNDALLLADEARGWFDRALVSQPLRSGTGVHAALIASQEDGDAETLALQNWHARSDPALRIALSCESLRLTTRLMHIIAWLLLQRAIASGELAADAASLPANRLGPSPHIDDALIAQLPSAAQRLIGQSRDLYRRVASLESAQAQVDAPSEPPVVARFFAQLQAAF